MRSSRLSILSAATIAVLGSMGSALAFAGRQVKEINFTSARDMPTGYPMGPQRKPSKSYPFSSTRQHRRNARTQVMWTGVNGHATMETLPSGARRNDAEIDRRLGLGK